MEKYGNPHRGQQRGFTEAGKQGKKSAAYPPRGVTDPEVHGWDGGAPHGQAPHAAADPAAHPSLPAMHEWRPVGIPSGAEREAARVRRGSRGAGTVHAAQHTRRASCMLPNPDTQVGADVPDDVRTDKLACSAFIDAQRARRS